MKTDITQILNALIDRIWKNIEESQENQGKLNLIDPEAREEWAYH